MVKAPRDLGIQFLLEAILIKSILLNSYFWEINVFLFEFISEKALPREPLGIPMRSSCESIQFMVIWMKRSTACVERSSSWKPWEFFPLICCCYYHYFYFYICCCGKSVVYAIKFGEEANPTTIPCLFWYPTSRWMWEFFRISWKKPIFLGDHL